MSSLSSNAPERVVPEDGPLGRAESLCLFARTRERIGNRKRRSHDGLEEGFHLANFMSHWITASRLVSSLALIP
jgi:hypothetical protein